MDATALRQALAGLALAIFGIGTADAGAFAVSPVRVNLSASRTVDSLQVRNDGTEATVVQLQLMHWQQEHGEDRLVASRDLIATPPIFTIPAGGSQVIRLGLRQPVAGQQEGSYRLLLQEVPPPPAADFKGLQVALRLSVPVFVQPAAAAEPRLQWQAQRLDGGGLRLRASNAGSAHLQLIGVRLVTADGSQLAQRELAAYLLPGQGREWTLAAGTVLPQGTPLTLVASSDAGELQHQFQLD